MQQNRGIKLPEQKYSILAGLWNDYDMSFNQDFLIKATQYLGTNRCFRYIQWGQLFIGYR